MTGLLLAACSDDEPATDAEKTDEIPSSPAQSPAPDDRLETAWELDIDVLSGPRVAGGVAVAYAVEGDRFFLVGVDGTSGDELWRQEASPGEVLPGITITPKVVADHPVYFRPSDQGNLHAQLVVADPATGDDVHATDPMLFRSLPAACPDDEGAVCLQARAEPQGNAIWYRLAVDGGALERDATMAAVPPPGRPLGVRGLLDIRTDNTEFLAVYESGEELWRRTVREVFGAGYSSTNGWRWTYDEETDRYIGYVGYPVDDSGEQTVADLADAELAALDRSTGEVLWVEEGVHHMCAYSLLVPTDEAVAEGTEHSGSVQPIPFRCRVSGTVTYGSSDAERDYDGIDVILEGYDPATGESEWELALGEARFLLGWPVESDQPLVRADRAGIVVDVDGEPTVVDLATGETRSVGDDTLWCSGEPVSFDYREPFYHADGEPNRERYGEMLYHWCDAAGEPLDEASAPPASVPNGLGVVVDDVTVVATVDGLVAYR